MKEKMKKFFTLTKRANAGFTLVELIVVIAILAILAGVGVPAYSAYVTKANKQADITLANEVAYALEVGYYSQGFDSGSATVVLTTDGAYCTDGNTTVDSADDVAALTEGTALASVVKAMSGAFGENWYSTLKLSYDKWEIGSVAGVVEAFNASTFKDQQDGLLSSVQVLTNSFEAIVGNSTEVVNLLGDSYVDYLDEQKVDMNDAQAVANTAVTYVASRTNVLNDTQKAQFATAWAQAVDSYAVFKNGVVDANNKSVLGTAGSLAALYAKAEAVVRYLDSKSIAFTNADPSDTTVYASWTAWLTAQQSRIGGTTTMGIAQSLDGVFEDLITNVMSNGAALSAYQSDYVPNQAPKDAAAYLATLGVIDDSSSVMLNNLGSDELYSGSIGSNLLNGYLNLGDSLQGISGLENGIGVVAHKGGNGCVVTIYPLDYTV